MPTLETSKHLYQPPLYNLNNGDWTTSYEELINRSDKLTIDIPAIMAELSFGQVSQNRTLFQEIKRLPWLSKVNEDGKVVLEEIPKHGFYTGDNDILAKLLLERLSNEARSVVKLYSKIYILLTGGLDSRTIAGVFKRLYDNGEIKTKPICLTWGQENSRDVVYAREMANSLNFEWQHIPLNAETVLENVKKCGEYLGLIHSPEMLHSMLWFKNIPKDSIVVAGSFGDSIGRAVFAGLHLLQLTKKTPSNTYNLLSESVFERSKPVLINDLNEIHSRGGKDTLNYMQCEYWMQGYRMRNGLCHALSVINKYARVYQMFTSPEVYSFMWSLHPARRDDDIYITLLKNYFPQLARIPWARTNKPILGNYSDKTLKYHYHDYTKWSQGVLYNEIKTLVDPEWFASKQIFNPASIEKLNEKVSNSFERVGRLNDIWLWLAGFRYYIDKLENEGKEIYFNSQGAIKEPKAHENFDEKDLKSVFILIASKSSSINKMLKTIRTGYRKHKLKKIKKSLIGKYPPKQIQ